MNTKLLKQKILDLAIRGKLVPQDPNDEPASELLKRIRAEKEKLIAEGKIKRSKKAGDKPHYENENVPFEIPASWEWVRLDDYAAKITDFVASGSFASLRENVHYYKEENYAILVRTADFGSNFQKDLVYLDKQGYDFLSNSNLVGGELILPNIGASIGKVFIVPQLHKPMTLGPNSILIRTYIEEMTKYLYFVFSSSWGFDLLHDISSATAQGKFNKTDLKNIFLPIPPIEEQRRIIQSINLWLAQIDNIDANKADLLYAIQQTRYKVLDLALHGQLVSQDPNDEPAIELLKRINPTIKPCDTSHYENLPDSWCICKFKDVFDITMGSSPTGDSLNNKHEGIEFHQGKLCFSELYLNKSEIYTDSPTKLAEKHSILLCVRAPVGVINITEREICIGRGLCSLKPKNGIDFMFAFYALQTHKSYFEANATGTTFKAIGGDTIRNEMFTLPPYDEQVRIRKKIESLFYELDLISSEL
jgi:type I restriction enzyme S subunit